MNTKVAVGLIVLTAVGTYLIAHPRRHHFEPTKFEGGAILLDTETGVLCSGRFGLKWSDANKKAVWAAGLPAKQTEDGYATYVSSHRMNWFDQVDAINQIAGTTPRTSADATFETLFRSMEDADSRYNALVKKADNEKVPDPDSSYIKTLPLCKDIR